MSRQQDVLLTGFNAKEGCIQRGSLFFFFFFFFSSTVFCCSPNFHRQNYREERSPSFWPEKIGSPLTLLTLYLSQQHDNGSTEMKTLMEETEPVISDHSPEQTEKEKTNPMKKRQKMVTKNKKKAMRTKKKTKQTQTKIAPKKKKRKETQTRMAISRKKRIPPRFSISGRENWCQTDSTGAMGRRAMQRVARGEGEHGGGGKLGQLHRDEKI